MEMVCIRGDVTVMIRADSSMPGKLDANPYRHYVNQR
jgi:hypothetical protein